MPQKPLYSRFDDVIMGVRGGAQHTHNQLSGRVVRSPLRPHYIVIGACCQVDCGITQFFLCLVLLYSKRIRNFFQGFPPPPANARRRELKKTVRLLTF